MSFTRGYKVNANTDYEFTVSNETIYEAVQADGGITETDIAAYCYSALIDSRIETVKAESHTDVQQPGWASWCQDNAMFYYIDNTRYIKSNTGINNTSDTVYERNFLIWFGTIYPNEPQEKTGWFLIMDIKDIKKFYVDFSNAGFNQTTVASTRTDNGVTTPFKGYTGDAYTYNSSLANVYPNVYTDNDQITTIRVVNVLSINNELWIGRLNPSNYGEASTAYSTYGYAMYIDYKLTGWLSQSDNEHLYQKGTVNWVGVPKIIDMDYPDLGFDVSPVIRTYADSTDDMIIDVSAEHYGGFPVATSAIPACKTINGILKWMSWCGLLFKYGGNTYKPIIQNGVIVGFSSDMFAPSEFDTMTNVTGNNISPIPPTPSTSTGDIETDMPLAYIGGTAGMVDFIKINASGLASADDIADAISRFDITTIGKDLLRNFVAFKCYAVLNIDDSVVRDVKVAGHTLKDENDHALQGEYIGSIAPVDFSAGRIEPLYNDYRDFAPYTRIQMYVPFCGWFDLPSWCMGKEITGTMFTDLYNGTVKAVIYASRTVVAEVGGCCAFDIPFAAESTGMKAGAVISSALNTVAMTGATIAAPNIATGIAAVSSAANFISAANSNGTTLKGVMGDGSNTNGLLHVYIKTTRPNTPDNKKAIPDKYKHEYGIPCYKELTLTAGDGYTQILDANIEGNMTDREKQMIIDGFRHGLIL